MPNIDTVPTEAECVASTVREADKPIRISTPADDIIDADTGRPAHLVDLLPPGWTSTTPDTNALLALEPTPRRSHGTVLVDSANDVITAVEQRRLNGVPPVVYTQPRDLTITAVLNDDHDDTPGWGDYVVTAQLRRTPEWAAWLNGQGLHTQDEFAEFIEDHLEDIETPPAAEMLELAQTFQAHTTARFSRASRLSSGVVALNYVEDQTVAAGDDGAITIPSEFTLVIRPFDGCDRYRVTARLRYRVGQGTLQIGWKLHRPEDIEATVMDEQVAAVAAAFGVDPISGRRR